MFRIGDFARLNKVSVKTLRYYDEIGILKPLEVDSQTSYRYYSANQIPKLNKILALKSLGFSLNEVTEIMTNNLASEIVVSMLNSKKAEIEDTIKQETSKLFGIQALIKKFEEDDTIMLKYDIVLKHIDSFKVASLRDVVADYSKQHYQWIELMTHIQKINAKLGPTCISIYYDCGYKESDVDIEVAQQILAPIPETDRIKMRDLPEVETMACTIHKGTYDDLPLAYTAILKWIEENGYTSDGPNRELYFEGEWSKANPEDYITEIQIPVKKIS